MRVAIICPYSTTSLVSHIADTFSADGVDLYFWAIEQTRPDVAQWTRGVGRLSKAQIWNALIPCCRAADLVLLTDDDIEFPSGFLNRYVDLIGRFGVDVSSPALTEDSSYTLVESIARDGLSARLVTWVDQMICAVSARAVREIFPLPDWLGPASWGVEYFFADALVRNGWTCAIFDELRVKHTFRPVGTTYSQVSAVATLLSGFGRHSSLSMIRSQHVLQEFPVDGEPRPPALDLSTETQAFLDIVRPVLQEPLLLLMQKASGWPPPDDRHARALSNAPTHARTFFRAMLFMLARAHAAGQPGAAGMINQALQWADSPSLAAKIVEVRRGVEDWYRWLRREPTLWHTSGAAVPSRTSLDSSASVPHRDGVAQS